MFTSQGLRRAGRRFIYCRNSRVHTLLVWFWLGTLSGEDTVEHCWLWLEFSCCTDHKSDPFPFFTKGGAISLVGFYMSMDTSVS